MGHKQALLLNSELSMSEHVIARSTANLVARCLSSPHGKFETKAWQRNNWEISPINSLSNGEIARRVDLANKAHVHSNVIKDKMGIIAAALIGPAEDAIVDLIAAGVSGAQNKFGHIHTLAIPAVPLLVDGIFDLFGANLSRLVVFGSAIRDDFDPETSDIDVAILLNHLPDDAHAGLSGLQCSIKDKLNLNVQFAIQLCAVVDRWANFELCWEGKVASGHVLIHSVEPSMYAPLDRDLVKAEVINNYLRQASQWHRRGLCYLIDDGLPILSEWEACRSACRALQAVLLRGEIDPSPKSIRWSLGTLFEQAVAADPRLEAVRSEVNGLNHSLASQEMADVLVMKNEANHGLRHFKSALSRAKRVISACRKIIND
jgi:predicted nucleotidyltransferase